MILWPNQSPTPHNDPHKNICKTWRLHNTVFSSNRKTYYAFKVLVCTKLVCCMYYPSVLKSLILINKHYCMLQATHLCSWNELWNSVHTLYNVIYSIFCVIQTWFCRCMIKSCYKGLCLTGICCWRTFFVCLVVRYFIYFLLYIITVSVCRYSYLAH